MINKGELLKHAEKLGFPPPEIDSDEERLRRKRSRTPRSGETAQQFAIQSAQIMDADHCQQIVILDLRGISPVCDYFVIANGTSDRQMRAVIDHIKEMGKSQGEHPYRISGYNESTWIVVDYVDVIVHLFNEEKRAYYDLDSLWGDGPHVPWEPSSV